MFFVAQISAMQIKKMATIFDEPEYKLPSIEYLRELAGVFLAELEKKEAAKTLAKLLVSKYVFVNYEETGK
jgi:hypothetical protein